MRNQAETVRLLTFTDLHRLLFNNEKFGHVDYQVSREYAARQADVKWVTI